MNAALVAQASDAATAARGRVLETLHRIATSHVSIETALVRITRRRAIGGSSDGDGGAAPSSCTHDRLRFAGRGDYAETCREREVFAADFGGFYVSPVYRQPTGNWGWDLCPRCAAA